MMAVLYRHFHLGEPISEAIRAEFKAQWWGTLLTEKLLRRE